MPDEAPEVPEAMVNLTQAIVETEELRNWFFALEKLPVNVRMASFGEMAAQMRKGGEDPDLAEAVGSLVAPEIYERVLLSVRALSGPGEDEEERELE